MQKISIKNMEVVSGAFGLPGAVIGGVVGATTYLSDAVFSDEEVTNTGLATAIASSAAIGTIGGPVGATALRVGAQAVVLVNAGFYPPLSH